VSVTSLANGASREPPRRISTSEILARLLRIEDDNSSLVGRIAQEVGRDIIEGRLQPGDQVNSVELAQRFSTSRTPVREALLLLEKEGLVEIPARRRPRVASVDLEPVREIYRVRGALVQLVSELICTNATDEQIQELRERFAFMRAAAEARDVDAYFWANVAFNDRATEIAGDRTLRRILDSLGLRVLQLRHLSMSVPSRMAQSVQDHDRLLKAYEERDVELAKSLHRSIILGALRAIERSGWEGNHAPGAPG
jgi:DNA-binding GntR family transcriptional regulator